MPCPVSENSKENMTYLKVEVARGKPRKLMTIQAYQPSIQKTPLYDAHQKYGAKMIEFGGWMMPVQYSGIIEEHRAVRTAAGMFDLSHMGEIEVEGPGALDFLQQMTTNDVSKLEVGQAQYNLLLYPDGGIVDDLIIYRLPDKYYLVVNASNTKKDYLWLREGQMNVKQETVIHNISYRTALISLQGPKALEILQPFVNVKLDDIKYYGFTQGQVSGVDAIIARTGYTGEDGFELFIHRTQAEKLWDELYEHGKAQGLLLVGLGARDTLRLEAKMALYGNDLDGATNPYEAGLGWVVKPDKGNFGGRKAIVDAKARGLRKKLVGFEMRGRGIARHGYPVAKDGKNVGIVTSGAPSPFLERNIGLAYVPPELATIGTTFDVVIRNQPVEAIVVKTPFYTRPDKR